MVHQVVVRVPHAVVRSYHVVDKLDQLHKQLDLLMLLQ
uniref:Uncharacterized protein n=2 Tax=Picea TaxID=3328 RepID=A0A101M0K8_PICGL|nr:hypothetical protein ABT39_MTgene4150 [Picea glauca]QHR90342.1 hypothetical protein Q903MT_gene4365 [Picea sitchensis]